MEPTRAAYEDYYARTQKELETLVWSLPSIQHSWYKNAEGKIHILSPWRLVDCWAWRRQPDLHSFAFS
jgi:4-hydroxyacetophenone monooxygenase